MARNQRPILSVVVDTYITHFIWASCSISFPLPPPDDRPSSSLGASFNAPSVAQIRHSSLEGQIRSGRPSLAALGIWAIQDALRLDQPSSQPLEKVAVHLHVLDYWYCNPFPPQTSGDTGVSRQINADPA